MGVLIFILALIVGLFLFGAYRGWKDVGEMSKKAIESEEKESERRRAPIYEKYLEVKSILEKESGKESQTIFFTYDQGKWEVFDIEKGEVIDSFEGQLNEFHELSSGYSKAALIQKHKTYLNNKEMEKHIQALRKIKRGDRS